MYVCHVRVNVCKCIEEGFSHRHQGDRDFTIKKANKLKNGAKLKKCWKDTTGESLAKEKQKRKCDTLLVQLEEKK